ncbi:MAG: CDP-diacylglycerol--glycerol-3-phosphate 3-phosphatidyltransferase [Holosporales bacterium]|jgi:CDP-diacylglycerol--glycerol-3-phosphate 3-phosphatidyltransferase|nr:CDP-diacylglycerol--glycerol-3-phosphate 3-phosphatidyltransferase [Holosporales bacterium]
MNYEVFILVPNILTSFRIVSIAAIVVCFYIRNNFASWLAAALFILACLTDFLDGFIARHWNQGSKLGQLLDPIADKLLVVVTILMLTEAGKISSFELIPAITIVMREILISGVREYLSSVGKELPVNKLSKCKTFIQMMSMVLLILSDVSLSHYPQEMHSVGIISLWIAAIITTVSGVGHLIAGLSYISSKN